MARIRDHLLMTLERSRNSYEVIKTLPQETKTRAMQEIAAATASGDFETFYPFLDMKNQRPGDYLPPFNLRPLTSLEPPGFGTPSPPSSAPSSCRPATAGGVHPDARSMAPICCSMCCADLCI
ncbi:MAG: hypothetical protein F4137_04370 [Acidobacteria bacterium]|nr:hypothetical protein [Acidobacteriota bacterium]MYH28091.1 hypothetical protein [Acidobacteriota bacterium]